MSKQRKLTLLNWGMASLLMLLFLLWHGAFEGPLSSEEVAFYAERYQQLHPGEDLSEFRRFLEGDDGRPVVMVNAIGLYDRPISVNGKDYGESSAAALSEYTGFVVPYLLRRGSYPVFSGNAVMDSLEVWGIDNAEAWSSGALMRYRSRRVMIEMATDPEFVEFHDAKIAAMEKTFAFPTRPALLTGNLTLVVGLGLLVLALAVQLLLNWQGYRAGAGSPA